MVQSAIFRYRALDPQGGDVAGEIEALSEREALDRLSARGLSPYSFEKSSVGQTRTFFNSSKLNRKSLARFLRQLSALAAANVQILDAFSGLARSRAHPELATRSRDVMSSLRAGQSLSTALESAFPEYPSYVIRLADLGEATGTLSKALTDAAERYEYELKVRSDIQSALTYPAFLASFGVLILTLMFLFVVPRFATLLGDGLANAPMMSQVVIGFGVWLKENILAFGAAAALLTVALAMTFRNASVKQSLRASLERAPLIGSTLREAEIGGWCRTVGVALQNHAHLVDALRLGEESASSAVFRNKLERVRRQVRAGEPLEEALIDAAPECNDIVYDLVKTGRASGTLGDMLVFAASLYEQQNKERAKQITALAEPIAITAISVTVGAVIVSIVLAMTTIYDFSAGG